MVDGVEDGEEGIGEVGRGTVIGGGGLVVATRTPSSRRVSSK